MTVSMRVRTCCGQRSSARSVLRVRAPLLTLFDGSEEAARCAYSAQRARADSVCEGASNTCWCWSSAPADTRTTTFST